MARKFKLAYNTPEIELPEVDEFLDEFVALCEKHDMGFHIDSDYEYGTSVTLTTLTEARESDHYLSFENVDDIRGIPTVDAKRRALEAERDRLSNAKSKARREKLANEMPDNPLALLSKARQFLKHNTGEEALALDAAIKKVLSREQ